MPEKENTSHLNIIKLPRHEEGCVCEIAVRQKRKKKESEYVSSQRPSGIPKVQVRSALGW